MRDSNILPGKKQKLNEKRISKAVILMDIVTDLRSENYKGQQNCISFSGTNVVKWARAAWRRLKSQSLAGSGKISRHFQYACCFIFLKTKPNNNNKKQPEYSNPEMVKYNRLRLVIFVHFWIISFGQILTLLLRMDKCSLDKC